MQVPNAAMRGRPSALVGSPSRRTAEFLADILDSWRYQVEVVGSGEEALARLEAAVAPTIALLDIELEKPSASEVLARLNQHPEGRRTWLMLMGTNPTGEELRRAVGWGCDDFFPVPQDAAELKLRVRLAERVSGLMAQLQRQAAELRYQSTHDGLTGLWNREALLSLLFRETDRVQRMKTDLCLMLLDLDDFSRINHDYGHENGDRMLSGLAERFRRQMRSYDLIGRCGEDEFLIGLPGCTGESALALADRIRETILGRPFTVEGEAVQLSGSFGIGESRGRAPMVVLREAERALAEAKMAGKNCARRYAPVEWEPAGPVLAGSGEVVRLRAG